MTNMTSLLAAVAFSLLAFAGSQAAAQSCTTDSDCPQSFACVVTGTSTAPVCKGTDCPADAGASDPIVYKGCAPKDCVTDADCGTGMVCYEQKTTACSGSGGSVSGCAANTKCDAGTVVTTTETCTTTTRNICAFKWQLPCNTDSDCGDAFVCDPIVAGGCASASGGVSAGPNGTSGGTSGGSSSSPPAADAGAPICTTTPQYPGTCRAKATSCTDDSVCPSGWTCTAIGTPTPVVIRGAGSSTTLQKDASAGLPADSVDAGGATTKICIGPFGAGAPTRGIDLGIGGQTATSNHAGTGGSGGSTSPSSAGSNATGGTTGGASATPGSSSGACAVAAPGPADPAFLLLGLVTVGLALVKRRQRGSRP